MPNPSTLHVVISTLLDRGAKLLEPFAIAEDCSAISLCEILLSSRGEASGVALAGRVLDAYRALSEEQKLQFFLQLAEPFDPNPERINNAAQHYSATRSAEALAELNDAVEPPRQELLRRINQSPGGTAALVAMRGDLLPMLKLEPTLKRIDNDFAHLLSSWFNRGFLQLERITWSTPADVLEKIIDHEAVHEIADWDELRRRLQPSDRRCYAFFHPAMPDEPLVFVEVALGKTAADNIVDLLSQQREVIAAEHANTAIFYSISNCQTGLRGVSFGNFLIKQVVADLLVDLPELNNFITLSPVPGFSAWLSSEAKTEHTERAETARELLALSTAMGAEPEHDQLPRHALLAKQLAAQYLLQAKRDDQSPLDPVARFHLDNGALLDRIHPQANLSTAGLAASAGVMVNYRYDLTRIEENHEAYAAKRRVATSRAVQSLIRKPSGDNLKPETP